MNILVIAFFTTCGQTDQGDCGVRLPKIISDTMWTDRVLPGQQHIHTHSQPAVTWQPGADHMVKAGQVSWQLCRAWPQQHNTRAAIAKKKKKKLYICKIWPFKLTMYEQFYWQLWLPCLSAQCGEHEGDTGHQEAPRWPEDLQQPLSYQRFDAKTNPVRIGGTPPKNVLQMNVISCILEYFKR